MESILILQHEVLHTHGRMGITASRQWRPPPPRLLRRQQGEIAARPHPAPCRHILSPCKTTAVFQALIFDQNNELPRQAQDKRKRKQSRLVLPVVVVSLTHRSSATVSVIPSQTSQGWQSRCLLRSNASCISNRCEKEQILQRDRGQCLYTIYRSIYPDRLGTDIRKLGN